MAIKLERFTSASYSALYDSCKKTRNYNADRVVVSSSTGGLLELPVNIVDNCGYLLRTNNLAYFAGAIMTKKKCF